MHPQCLSLEWHRSHGVVGGGCLERGVVARSGGPVGRTETLEALGEDWRREAARCGGGAVVTEKRG